MSELACWKEIVCLVAESADSASKYGEFVTPDELRECAKDAERYKNLRIELANRADAASRSDD